MRTKGWVLGLALAFAACTRTETPSQGGETNWLSTCKGDVDCAVGRCTCGVCSTACDTSGDCTSAFEGSCVGADSRIGASVCNSTKGWVPALCLPDCSSDAACGVGFACRDGACVTLEHALEFDSAPMESDAGRPPVVPADAGDGRDAVAGTCPLSEAPNCMVDDGSLCTWEDARDLLPECWIPALTPYRKVRCGEYDGVVVQGTDSWRTLFYNARGVLVGENEGGLGARGCTAYDPSFSLSPCQEITPQCPACTATEGALCEPISDPLCALGTARDLVPECRMPFVTSYHEVRCGEYTGIVAQAIDSRHTFLYEPSGAVVARKDESPEGPRCTAVDSSFRFPACTDVTPECTDPQGACDCDAQEQSVACVCSFVKCQPFVVATNPELCQAGNPNPSLIQRGCGLTLVSRSAGLGSTAFLYDASEEVVGAAITNDVPLGECGRSSYRTALPDLTQCDDYTVCSLCDSTEYEKCEP